MEPQGKETTYTALAMHAMHKDEESRNTHDRMGVGEGWGKALDHAIPNHCPWLCMFAGTRSQACAGCVHLPALPAPGNDEHLAGLLPNALATSNNEQARL
jgi:hypothetical protein